jgi:DNA-binding transcriptional LysR family regulator
MSARSVHDERLAIVANVGLNRMHRDCKIKTAARRQSRSTAFPTLNLNALLVFATVADANSFSEGARRLRLPVSTVSRQVADLEAQLGARLLERSTRSLKLTGIGAEVFEEARATVDIGKSILGLVSSRLSSVSGLLRILVPPSIANSLITPLVGAFQASYPDVRVHMTISDRAADLSTGDFDLLVQIGPMKDSSRISQKILTFRDRLLASPTYIETCKVPETPKELLGHRLLAFSSCRSEIEWSFANNHHQDKITLTIEPYLSVNDPASLADALLAGMGIGNLPSLAVGEFIEKGKLVEIMPQWRFNTLDVSIVHASSRYVPRPVQEFIRFTAKLAPVLVLPRQALDRGKLKREEASEFDARTIP